MSEWTASVNVDGLKVAGVDGHEKERVANEALYYASQYIEESEKRITITIQKRNDNAQNVL